VTIQIGLRIVAYVSIRRGRMIRYARSKMIVFGIRFIFYQMNNRDSQHSGTASGKIVLGMSSVAVGLSIVATSCA
jgi:hypothetical protein